MTEQLLSIIIPCYNSAKFLDATLDMLISQELHDCEVIVVNDGSRDGTSYIAHQYANKYREIKVVDKENEGVSIARNIGMNIASGKYIYFLDSDDSLASGTLDFFRKAFKENDGKEFFAFGYYTSRNGKFLKNYSFQKYDGMHLSPILLKQLFLRKKICFHICSCIYERDFLQSHNICFTPGLKVGEDVEFLLKVLCYVSDCGYFARHCFIYQIRDDSAMQGYKSYSIQQANTISLFYKVLSDNYPCEECDKDFFLANYYVSQLLFYLKSTVKENAINDVFALYEFLLDKKITVWSFRRIVITVFQIIKPHNLIMCIKHKKEA